MERYSNRTIDELGRFTLHSSLRERLGLLSGSNLSLTKISNLIILQKAQNNSSNGGEVCQISELGVITLPVEMRQNLGLQTGNKIALYHTDETIIIKSA